MMLHPLTNYLLQYKQVCIPHVGTLRLVPHPPTLNVADKILEPPFYTVKIAGDENPSDHQLNYLQNAAKDGTAVQLSLHYFGNDVKKKMNDGGYDWEGIGTLKNNGEPLRLTTAALQPIKAEKVIRRDAVHNVLVGDKEMTSAQAVEQNTVALRSAKKPSAAVLIGWVLLALAIVAIAVLLYLGGFDAKAAGSKLSPAG